MTQHIYRRYLAVIFLVCAVVGADRLLKAAAQALWQFHPVKTEVFSITYFENPYIAFSIPLSGLLLEGVIGVIVVAVAVLLWRRVRRRLEVSEWGLALLLGGAMSNWYDRLHYGFIIDYVQIGNFPVFNLADAAITAGALCLAVSLWRNARYL